MTRLFARSFVAALTLGTLAVSQVAKAQTEAPVLVYGNSGLSIGFLPLAGTVPETLVHDPQLGDTHTAIAQGFTVGANAYDMVSVDIGLYTYASLPTLDIALFSSTTVNGQDVPGTRIRTFNNTPTNRVYPVTEGRAVYNFAFDGTSPTVRLNANTKYWVVLSYTPQVSGQPMFLWNGSGTFYTTDESRKVIPTQQSDSGFSYLGTVAKHTFIGEWEDHGPNAGAISNPYIRFGVRAVPAPVVTGGGGGNSVTQEPPVLDCYALSKGFFRNKYPSGWPASVINSSADPNVPSVLIGNRAYSINQLRTMLATNSTGGNQIGQLASQLVAVHLSRELAKQTAGPAYAGWDGWAPDSASVRTAYQQAAELVNATAGFDSKGKLTGTIRNVSPLINLLDDGYIQRFHCD